ncbi:MAG: tetratricopeptide repeat protein [Planctomycetota bacterium]|jgi:tetratricopeptide (TPR) repeat protein
MSGRAVWAVTLVVVIVSGAWLSVWIWRRSDLPAPPALPASLDRADRDVAEFIRRVHAEVARAPRHAEGWSILGRTFEVNQLPSEALACYRQAIALEPGNPRFHYDLAVLAAATGDVAGAEAELRRILALDDAYAPAQWRLGGLLLDAYRLDEAEQAFRRAMELDPRDPAGWCGLARVHLHRGEMQQAIDRLEPLLTWVPVNQHYVHQLLGRAYRQAGQREAADAALARGRGETMPWPDPWRDEMNALRRDSQWLHQYAVSLISAGRPDQAVGLLTNLLESHPDDPSLQSNLAVAWRTMGRLDRSIELLERTVRDHPAAHEAQFNLALAYRIKSGHAAPNASDDLRKQAMRHVEDALAANPSYAPALGLRGELLVQAGDTDAGLAAYRDATHADPATPIWLYREGDVLAAAGRLEEAEDALDESLRRMPTYVPALLRLAELRLEQGDVEAARRLAARVQRLKQGDPRAAAILEQARRDGAPAPEVNRPAPPPGGGR